MRNDRLRTRVAIAVAFAATFGIAIPAITLAQQSQPKWRDTLFQQRDTLAKQRDTLEAITVRVMRLPFSILQIPYSVAIVSSHDATDARTGLSLDDVLGRLAGVQVDNRLNLAVGERIAIRGMGARAQFGVRGIRLVVDGIPATLADGQSTLNNIDLASLGSAEVLRGPVSSLYGNAAGGVVLLRSALPPPDKRVAPMGELLAGSDELLRWRVGAGGTTGPLGYTVSGGNLRYDGYRAFSDARNTHANGVFTYRTGHTNLQFVGNTVRYHAHNPGSLTDSARRVDPRQAYANNIAHKTGETGQQTQSGIHLTTPIAGGIAELSVYVLHRGIENPIPPSIIALSRNAQGIRATYSKIWAPDAWRLAWIVGTESDAQHDDRQNYVNQNGARGIITLDQREHVRTIAPFTEWHVTHGPFGIVSGIRADYYHFSVADRLVTNDNPDDSGRRTMRAISPSIGVTYTISSTTLYANVSTAFQTPTTTELANRPDGAGGFNPTLQPEHTHSQELGINGAAFGRVVYHGALYHQRITDALVPFELPSAPGRSFYRNVGTTRQRGAETEVSTTWGLTTVRATYTYTDARIRRDSAAINGNRVPGIAPHLATLTIDQGTTDRFVAAELRAQGAMPVDDANAHRAARYVVTNLRGQWTVKRGTALFGGIGNLFDVRYDASVIVNAAGNRYYEPAAGRTVYGGVSFGRRSVD